MVAITRSTVVRRLQSSSGKITKTPAQKRKITKQKKRTAKQRTAPSSSSSSSSNATAVTNNTATISAPLQAYNDVKGKSDITDALAYDCHWNPVGREYDLGRDGAFMGFNILIGTLVAGLRNTDMQNSIDALKLKGFQVKYVGTEDECIKELDSNQYQVVWILSGPKIENRNIISSLTTFQSNGGAVFMFADNTPLVCHANEFLGKKFGVTVKGDYYASQTLTYAENGHQQKGHFGQHEIFTGVKNLYEGVTICHPVYSTKESREKLVPIATASDGNTCIAVYDPPASSRSNEGRICLDCGYTKLYCSWDAAGTARYIVNASCWLLRIENRFT